MVITDKAISVKGKALLEALVKALTDVGHGEHDYDVAEVPEEWKDYPLLWSGWGLDRDGCCREGGVFGDMAELEGEIRDMFGYYFRTIRDFALKEIGSDAFFDCVVEPSYADNTCYVMSDDDTIIIKGDCKAWNFGADSPEELAEMMEDDYNTIRNNITAALIKKGSVSEAKEGELRGSDIHHVVASYQWLVVLAKDADGKDKRYYIDPQELKILFARSKFIIEEKRVRTHLHPI